MHDDVTTRYNLKVKTISRPTRAPTGSLQCRNRLEGRIGEPRRAEYWAESKGLCAGRLLLLLGFCLLAYTLKSRRHVYPAQCPAHALLARVRLGPFAPPTPHPILRTCSPASPLRACGENTRLRSTPLGQRARRRTYVGRAVSTGISHWFVSATSFPPIGTSGSRADIGFARNP
jgi:hypothetical protein